MKEKTFITERGGMEMVIDHFAPVKIAISLARENGLTGRLEIQHLLSEEKENVIFSLYFINQKNEIVGHIFPYKQLWCYLPFDEAITSETEQQPH